MPDFQYLITPEVLSEELTEKMKSKPHLSIKWKPTNVVHRLVLHAISTHYGLGSNNVESILNLALYGVAYLKAVDTGFGVALNMLSMAKVPEDVSLSIADTFSSINALTPFKGKRNAISDNIDDDYLDQLS